MPPRAKPDEVCKVDSHYEGDTEICGLPAIGRVDHRWPIPVCKFHARTAESNGLHVEYFKHVPYWES